MLANCSESAGKLKTAVLFTMIETFTLSNSHAVRVVFDFKKIYSHQMHLMGIEMFKTIEKINSNKTLSISVKQCAQWRPISYVFFSLKSNIIDIWSIVFKLLKICYKKWLSIMRKWIKMGKTIPKCCWVFNQKWAKPIQNSLFQNSFHNIQSDKLI